jgi:hypothetical protein
MKRIGLGILGGALLILLLPMTLSSCAITCGCLSTPDPNWTPPQITAQEAASKAAQFTGVTEMTTELHDGLDGHMFFLATAPGVIAFVDSTSGTVLEVIFVDEMPGSVAPPSPALTDGPNADAARRQAETYMAARGVAVEGFTATTVFRTVAGAGTYDITWTKTSNGVPDAFYQVSVNAISANVYAFLDLRMGLPLTAPVVGGTRAAALAADKLGLDPGQVTSTHLSIDFSTDVQVSTWAVQVSGTVVWVDAATGTARLVQQ